MCTHVCKCKNDTCRNYSRNGGEDKAKQSGVNPGIIKGNRRDVKNRLRSACILISKMIFMNVMGKK
jgi:hypothetical protein